MPAKGQKGLLLAAGADSVTHVPVSPVSPPPQPAVPRRPAEFSRPVFPAAEWGALREFTVVSA